MKNYDHTTILQEEELLRSQFGASQPFRTPEGYFEAFPERVMQTISARRQRRMLWRWAAAAIFTGLVCTTAFLQNSRQAETEIAQEINKEYIEDALDYTMIDNLDIATFLTEAE